MLGRGRDNSLLIHRTHTDHAVISSRIIERLTAVIACCRYHDHTLAGSVIHGSLQRPGVFGKAQTQIDHIAVEVIHSSIDGPTDAADTCGFPCKALQRNQLCPGRNADHAAFVVQRGDHAADEGAVSQRITCVRVLVHIVVAFQHVPCQVRMVNLDTGINHADPNPLSQAAHTMGQLRLDHRKVPAVFREFSAGLRQQLYLFGGRFFLYLIKIPQERDLIVLLIPFHSSVLQERPQLISTDNSKGNFAVIFREQLP